jgi:hypothetical protein
MCAPNPNPKKQLPDTKLRACDKIIINTSILELAAEKGHFDAAELLLSAKVC